MEGIGFKQFCKSIQRQDGIKVKLQVKPKHQFSKKRKVKTWSPEEDQQLITLYQEQPKKWAVIASMMTDRNQNQCLHRYRRITQFGIHRKIWSPQQDQTIKKLMKKVGKNWKLLSQMLGSKTGKQIRQRFINKLDPKIKKEQWSDEQDRRIIELYCQIGRKWSQISKYLPGRPENKIKNRFYSYIQKNYDIKYKPCEQNIIIHKKSENSEIVHQNYEIRPSLKQISNQIQKNGQSLRDICKEQKFFILNLPSINHLDLEMKIDDFPLQRPNRRSRMQIGSMIKIEEDWGGNKQKDYGLCANIEFQPHLFYFPGN